MSRLFRFRSLTLLGAALLLGACSPESVAPPTKATASPSAATPERRVRERNGEEALVFVVPLGEALPTEGDWDVAVSGFQNGLKQAREWRTAGRAVRVVLGPGLYREDSGELLLDLPGDKPLLIEAQVPGTAVISGADLWTDWTRRADGVYEKPWPHDWGASGIDYTGRNDVLGQRREMVFVDGELLEQVDSEAGLVPGSFRVDEAGDRLQVRPPLPFTDLNAHRVEVSVRGGNGLLWARGVDQLTVRGLVFEKAATEQRRAAVQILRSAGLVVEDCVSRDNSWGGFNFNGTHGMVFRRNRALRNGAMGASVGFMRDGLWADSEFSGGGWRAQLGGMAGWDTAGFKCGSVTTSHFERLISRGNSAHGFWFDTNVTEVDLVELLARQNGGHGIYIEKNHGAIRVESCRLERNGLDGLHVVNTPDLVVRNCRLLDNVQGQLGVHARETYPPIRDWQTNAEVTLSLRGWRLEENVLFGRNRFRPILRLEGTRNGAMAASLKDGFQSRGNVYINADPGQAFSLFGQAAGLPAWQSLIGGDADARFTRSQEAEEKDY